MCRRKCVNGVIKRFFIASCRRRWNPAWWLRPRSGDVSALRCLLRWLCLTFSGPRPFGIATNTNGTLKPRLSTGTFSLPPNESGNWKSSCSCALVGNESGNYYFFIWEIPRNKRLLHPCQLLPSPSLPQLLALPPLNTHILVNYESSCIVQSKLTLFPSPTNFGIPCLCIDYAIATRSF